MTDRGIYSNSFLGLISANMLFWMSVNFFLPVLPIYYHSLGMNDHQVGIAVGIFSLGSVTFRVLSGRAVDRYGSKPVITMGVIVSIAAMIGYYYTSSLLPTSLMRFIHGAGISGYSAATLTMATLMNEERNITKTVAVYTLFTMIGTGFASSSANYIFGCGGMPFIIGCGIAASLVSLAVFPKSPKLIIKPAAAKPLPLRTVAAAAGVAIPTASLFAVNFCFSSIMTFLPLFMLSRGISNISPFFIGYAVAVVFTRLWINRLCQWMRPEKIAFYILLLLASILICAAYFAAPWTLPLCGAGIGVGYGLAFPTMATTVTASTEPASRGMAFGFFTMAVDFGFAAGAVAMGAIAELWGYEAVFWTAAIYSLAYAALYKAVLIKKLV